jgi:hypothetical protein
MLRDAWRQFEIADSKSQEHTAGKGSAQPYTRCWTPPQKFPKIPLDRRGFCAILNDVQ